MFWTPTQPPLAKHPRSETEVGKSDDGDLESAFKFLIVVFGGGARRAEGVRPTPSYAQRYGQVSKSSVVVRLLNQSNEVSASHFSMRWVSSY